MVGTACVAITVACYVIAAIAGALFACVLDVLCWLSVHCHTVKPLNEAAWNTLNAACMNCYKHFCMPLSTAVSAHECLAFHCWPTPHCCCIPHCCCDRHCCDVRCCTHPSSNRARERARRGFGDTVRCSVRDWARERVPRGCPQSLATDFAEMVSTREASERARRGSGEKGVRCMMRRTYSGSACRWGPARIPD